MYGLIFQTIMMLRTTCFSVSWKPLKNCWKSLNQWKFLKILHMIFFQTSSCMFFMSNSIFVSLTQIHWSYGQLLIIGKTKPQQKWISPIELCLYTSFSKVPERSFRHHELNQNGHKKSLIFKLFKCSFINQNVWLLPSQFKLKTNAWLCYILVKCKRSMHLTKK